MRGLAARTPGSAPAGLFVRRPAAGGRAFGATAPARPSARPGSQTQGCSGGVGGGGRAAGGSGGGRSGGGSGGGRAGGAGGADGGGSWSWGRGALLVPAAAAVAMTCAPASVALAKEAEEVVPGHVAPEWEDRLAATPGIALVMRGSDLLDHDSPFLEDDHMFSAFVAKGILKDLTGYYHVAEQKWHMVISLGDEVCGFPQVVHGGLTAALFDESFGGLLFSLKGAKQLPFWGHAYTAQLNVTYKALIPSGKALLCTARVESIEGRKLWMAADVRDGPEGKVYATARALFVAPKTSRAILDIAAFQAQRAYKALFGGSAK